MACCGDVPTLEALAAVNLLRERLPDLRIRVVNVVDLMALQPPSEHPHGLPDEQFDQFFPPGVPVVFAFHGYPAVIHRLTYRRHNHDNIHVRGYKEEGTTTTPFDMCVLNNIDRFQLALDAIKRVPRIAAHADAAEQWYSESIQRHKLYVAENGDDLPEIRDWRWPGEANLTAELALPIASREADALTRANSPELERFSFMSSLPILVLNSGSSSIKFSMYEAGDGERASLIEGAVDGIGTDLGKFWIKDADGKKLVDETPAVPTRAVAFKLVADALHSGKLPAPATIGHRTVCGGPTITENQLITPKLIDEIESYQALAPLHTPIAVYIMREALKLFPGLPNFAILDTYFHRTLPEVAKRMPIPTEYVDMGVRRYGYHGISYESIVYQLQPDVPEKLIVAHLGNGASISAIRNGKCLDTSMALTPTSGIISGSRTGDIDPGVLIFILKQIADTTPNTLEAADKLETVVSKKSGLLGVSELSNDMRDLREAIKDWQRQGAAGGGQVHLDHRPLDRQLCGRTRRARYAGLYRRHRRKRHCLAR